MILHYAKENRLVRLGSFIFRAFLNADVFGCVLLFSNGNGRDLLGLKFKMCKRSTIYLFFNLQSINLMIISNL